MSSLSPDRLSATIALICDELARGIEVGGQGTHNQHRRESVADCYRWLHTAGHDRKVGGESTSLLCKKCNRTGWVLVPGDPRFGEPAESMVPARCEDCTSPTGSDPTGETIVARETVLNGLDRVGGKAIVALEAVKDMVSELQRIVGQIDRGVDVEPPNERAIPRTATKRELDKANAANQRRQERGESWGEG